MIKALELHGLASSIPGYINLGMVVNLGFGCLDPYSRKESTPQSCYED